MQCSVYTMALAVILSSILVSLRHGVNELDRVLLIVDLRLGGIVLRG